MQSFPFILPYISSVHQPAYMHVMTMCVFVYVCVTLCCLLAPSSANIHSLSSAVMHSNDKAFCGALWRRGGSCPRALEVTGAIAALCAPSRRDTLTGVELWINLPVNPRGSKTNMQRLGVT